MSETCRTKTCSNDIYGENDRCIFHCDKSGFDNDDIRVFWENIRGKYVKYYNGHINDDITIENVIFPKFGLKEYYRKRFFQSGHSEEFNNDVTFKKCIFTDNFDLEGAYSRRKILFDNCTFFGTIGIYEVNELEISNSEFKNEILLGNNNWNKLNINNTKFIKDVNITAKDNLNVFNNCIFRGNLKVDGGIHLILNFESSSCNKILSIQNTVMLNITNVELKSNVFFKYRNSEIYINGINFKKDVSFDEFSKLSIVDSEFNKKINFNSEKYNQINIDNSTMNKVKLASVDNLKISNKSEIKDNLELSGDYKEIVIDDAKINKKFDVHNANKVILKNLEIGNILSLSGSYDDILISESSFIDLIIGTPEVPNMQEKSDNGIESEILEIGKVTKLELNNLKSSPSVKLVHDKYEEVIIKDSKFIDLEINFVQTLSINKSTISGTLSFLGESNGNITLDTVILKNKCNFVDMSTLILNKCRFYKEIDLNKITSITSNDTHFKSEVKFLAAYATIVFKECEFHKKVNLSKVSNMLEIKSSLFKDEVDLSNSVFNVVNIFSSNFEGKLLLSTSTIQKIDLNASAEELSENNLFSELVDFTDSHIRDIKIYNSDFNAELNFVGMKRQINLSNITSSKIENLKVSNSLVIDLFKDSNFLTVNNFTLEKSKLDTTGGHIDEIDINGITIQKFEWDKVILLKIINFYEMNISDFIIKNSNIEHRFRMKESDIGVFNLKASTFEDLQIIDNKRKSKEKQIKLLMTNTTIKNAVLDKLKYGSFIMGDAHVSEAKIGNVTFDKGSRETNRFFKNYYDSISDYIQANDYYKDEMIEQYKKVKKYSSEWFVLDFGKGISNFGQSWFKPFIWAILFTLLFYRIANFDLLSADGFRESHISWMFNDVIKFANPFSKSSSSSFGNYYWAWMVHKLFMTVFIYHFVVAIKRKTQR